MAQIHEVELRLPSFGAMRVQHSRESMVADLEHYGPVVWGGDDHDGSGDVDGLVTVRVTTRPADALADLLATVRAGPAERVEDFPGNAYLCRDGDHQRQLVSLGGGHAFVSEFDSPDRTMPRHVQVWRAAAEGVPSVPSLVLRVYRDLLQHALHSRGYAMLHCSMVERGGVARAFVGDKGAGKSAWLCRSLRHGWNYVANDRVLVDESGHAVAYPIAAMLRRETLANTPLAFRQRLEQGRLRRRDHLRPGYDKHGVTPRELARAFGVAVMGEARLTELLVLEHTPRSGSARTTPVSLGQVRDRLVRNLYYPQDPTYRFDIVCRPLERERCPQQLVGAIAGGASLRTLRFDWPTFDRRFDHEGEWG
ncbi:MAG: hypothetical protein K0V04_03385 [Deltaproteobacteria bacterium]|nr:hypothetical protein [Deltaproteobacteria bacterium]